MQLIVGARRGRLCRAGILCLTGFASLALSGGIAQAQTVALQDNFATMVSNLGAASQALFVQGGKFHIKATATHGNWDLYNGLLFTDADVSVDAVNASTTPINYGLIFWASDVNNYYLLQVDPAAATAALFRYVGGNGASRWIVIQNGIKTSALKTGQTDVNTLRVVTTGGTVTLYVNGQKIASAIGQVPTGGGMVGMYVQSPGAAPSEAAFANFKVLQ